MEAPQEGAKLTDDTLVYPMPKRNEEEFSGASEAVEAQEEENNAGMNETIKFVGLRCCAVVRCLL